MRFVLPLGIGIPAAIIAIVIIILACGWSTPVQKGENGPNLSPSLPPETLNGWVSVLQDHEWRMKSDNTIKGNAIVPAMRFVTYTKSLGDLTLSACMMLSPDKGSIELLSLTVTGPFTSQTPVTEGFKTCAAIASRLLASAPEGIVRAVQNSKKVGSPDMNDGLPRSEGKSEIQGGWEVTCVEYLVGHRDSPDNAKILLMFSRKSPPDGPRPGELPVRISDISYKQIELDFGIATVGWQAAIENLSPDKIVCSVDIVFIDIERYELAKDTQYNVILLPGQKQHFTGRVIMKSQVYANVVDIQVNVRGYVNTAQK